MGNEVTEKKLRFLFGLQRFVQDPELKEVIDDTENNTGNLMKLSDYDLFSVSAGTGDNTTPSYPAPSYGGPWEWCWCPVCQQNRYRQRLIDGQYECEKGEKYFDQ